jgi:hypothetical protein
MQNSEDLRDNSKELATISAAHHRKVNEKPSRLEAIPRRRDKSKSYFYT